MNSSSRIVLLLCAMVGLAASSGFLPSSTTDALASDPPSGGDSDGNFDEDQEERDDPSFEVVYVRKLGKGNWKVVVQNDYGYGGTASGTTKREAEEAGETLADKWNSGPTSDCVDLCDFWPSLCE